MGGVREVEQAVGRYEEEDEEEVGGGLRGILGMAPRWYGGGLEVVGDDEVVGGLGSLGIL